MLEVRENRTPKGCEVQGNFITIFVLSNKGVLLDGQVE